MFNFFKKSPEEISRTNPGYEETERKTPKLGLLLLLIMCVVGLFFGWRALDNLAAIPQKPGEFSYCSGYYAPGALKGAVVKPYEGPEFYKKYDSDYYLDSYSSCLFNEEEVRGGVPALFEERRAAMREYSPLYVKLTQISDELAGVQNNISRATGEYGVGLQEKSAGITQPVFPTDVSSAQLLQLRQEEARLIKEQDDMKAQLDSIKDSTIAPVDEKIRAAYVSVFEKQNVALRWYDFKVFLLQILFAFPLFLVAFWYYLRLHRKNSPYTIIMTSIVVVGAVMLARVILVWFWGLFLERILDIIMEWFRQSQLVRTLLFYGGMLLSFGALGGAVYALQKRVFDPRRVAIRRFRQKQCPNCQTNLDLSAQFCPNCGHKIREDCATCKKERFVEMPFCPHCGNKK